MLPTVSLFMKAIIIGAANVMPGISGATLTVIFRVYDRLINAINGLVSDWRASFGFLIPFGLGMGIGIVGVGSAISILIGMFSLQSAGFIAGLMAGSIPFLYAQAVLGMHKNNAGQAETAPPMRYYVATGIAALIIIGLSIFAPTPELYVNGELGLGAVLLLFAGGLLAAAAMVVPGVSGAMVLILLGIYPLAMNTINDIRAYLATPFEFSLLIPILWVVVPVGLGILPGILLASRGIAVLLERHFSLTYFIIIGLVIGTVFALFNDPRTYESGGITVFSTVATAIIFVVGVVLAQVLGKKSDVN